MENTDYGDDLSIVDKWFILCLHMFFCAALHKVTLVCRNASGKKRNRYGELSGKKNNSQKSVLSGGFAALYSKMNNRENVILFVEPKEVIPSGFAEFLQLQAKKRELTFGRSR